MPDPNEIAAAAERLRRMANGESLEAVYGLYILPESQRMIDYVVCGDAYLAEHADEPVTREWLVGVLGEPTCKAERLAVWRNPIEAAQTISDRGDYAAGCTCDDPDSSVDLDTRADVLAFLRLVRWPDNQERGASRGE